MYFEKKARRSRSVGQAMREAGSLLFERKSYVKSHCTPDLIKNVNLCSATSVDASNRYSISTHLAIGYILERIEVSKDSPI